MSRLSVRRGVISGLTSLSLLVLALLPSRLAVAMRLRGGSSFERVTRALAGTTLDLSAVIVPVGALLLVVVLLAALVPRARRAFWQQLGGPLTILPLCFTFYVVTVAQQEVKAERGAFSTVQEIVEGASQASFVGGSLGFFHYERIWLPGLACGGVALLLLVLRLRAVKEENGLPLPEGERVGVRASGDEAPLRGWALGMLGVLALGVGLAPAAVAAQAALSPAEPRWPGRSPHQPDRDLHRLRAAPRPTAAQRAAAAADAERRGGRGGRGAAGLAAAAERCPGAPCWPHPHARPLDLDSEAAPLLRALERVSEALFTPGDANVAVFQFSLESFRADDLHALNPAAPRGLDPFVNGLYERRGSTGVLASPKTFQAGVRSAQGLAAMTCGVGTLPYNLSIIRDLEAFPLRCAPDLLAEAGFHGAFFYGSDPGFDGMARFLAGHGVPELVSQDELPPNLPRGAWSGLTDFVVFDEAARRVAKGLAQAPQFALVMSLSNHSPYTPPEDLPAAVSQRVDEAMRQSVNRASKDDRRRLLTHSYTDAALERFFQQLDALELSERSIVLLMADHSTGEDYVWGADDVEHETDAAKAQVPFVLVIPPAFLARASDGPALALALTEAQALLDTTPLSQNDVPALLLALLKAHPGLRALPAAARWHTLGGQVTSPWFRPGGAPGSFLVGINGVDELYVLDRQGARVGSYEDVVFLRTRGERDQVTPRLIPVAATLVETLRAPRGCPETD